MENLQNLFPEFEWNIEEVRQEKREVYKQLKESAPYLSLICQEEKRTVFAEGKNFWSRKYQTYSEMWWEVRENTEASLGEKQYNYLMTFVKFRNRQLKKNMTRKKDMEECIESILAANIISSGKVWHWSDYSNEIKEILSKSGLALMTLHMAEKMKNHEDYLRCIHPYNF